MNDLLKEAEQIALKMGGCDPQWLHKKVVPEYRTTESKASGPEMILLHGLFGALSNWETVFPLFEKYSRPIALSFPLITAHRSEVKVKPLALYTWLFIQQKKLAPVALCGNSLGGHVAMRLYFAAPESVDCMILSGTSGLYEHAPDSLPIRPDRDFIREHMGRVFKNERFITDQAIEEIYAVVKDRANVLNIIHAARSAKRDNLLELLKTIKVPTLLLWGEDDEVTTMQVAETFHKNIRNSKLVSIKKCGHAPMIEHPEWFAEEVGKFLKEHSRHGKDKR